MTIFIGDIIEIIQKYFNNKMIIAIVLWNRNNKEGFNKAKIDQWIRDLWIIGKEDRMIQTFYKYQEKE